MDYDSYYTTSNSSQYTVNGYVTRNGIKQVGASVSIWIKDYSYSMGQCTFFCKTGYDGKYQFIITYAKWNRYSYRITYGGKSIEGKVLFGTVDRSDIVL